MFGGLGACDAGEERCGEGGILIVCVTEGRGPGVEMERGIAVAVVVCVLGLIVVGRVDGNGALRPKLWSILDTDGEWHVHASRGGESYLRGEAGSEDREEDGDDVEIWPMPYSVSHGDGKLMINRASFVFELADGAAVPDTLAKAFVRYYDLIFSQHAQHWDASPLHPVLTKLLVALGSSKEEVGHLAWSNLRSLLFEASMA